MERICGRRKNEETHELEYKVSWRGFPEEESNTWESVSDLANAAEAIRDYVRKAGSSSTPAERQAAALPGRGEPAARAASMAQVEAQPARAGVGCGRTSVLPQGGDDRDDGRGASPPASMSRKQSLVAAKFLQPLFNPAFGHKQWDAARRSELVGMVNTEFVRLGVESSYTVKKLECWLGNTMCRWRREQKGRQPSSLEARNLSRPVGAGGALAPGALDDDGDVGEDDSEENGEDGVFVVERVCDRRHNPFDGQLEYKVSWRGFPDEKHDTWEPVSDLTNAAEAIRDFESGLARAAVGRSGGGGRDLSRE